MRRTSMLVLGLLLATAFIPAAFATTDTIGNCAGNAVFGNTLFVSQKVVASGSGNLSSIGIQFSGAQTVRDFVIGIYADTGGTSPTGAPLSQGVAEVPIGGGWIDVTNLTATPGIVATTSYWLVPQTSGDNALCWEQPGAVGKYQLFTYTGTLPTWSTSGDTAYVVNMRMTYSLPSVGPQYSANTTKYPTPTAFNTSADYGFQITIAGAGGFFNTSNVSFEANFSGAFANHTNTTGVARVYNTSFNVFRINFTDDDFINASKFSYRWFMANGTGAAAVWNVTPSMTYEIVKSPTALHVALNGTEADASYVYNVIVNATAWPDVSGGTVSLARNGTSVSNPFYGNLSARVHNFTAAFTHVNYTAPAVMRYFTVTKSATTTSIAFAPASTVAENTPITATSSSNVSYVFYRDGIVITSPYAATLPFGIYNFTVGLYDAENYTGGVTTSFLTVTSGGFGCTDPNTYAFQLLLAGNSNTSTLNFTDAFANGFVKWDLSDVWVNTSNMTALRNQTGNNYYLVVNSTNATQYYVKFGNYIGNQSHANVTNATGVMQNMTAVSGYSQVNPYDVLTFYDEISGVQQLPPAANTTLSMFCSNGVSSFKINASRLLVTSQSQPSELKATVTYSPTEVYFRNLLVRASVEYKNFYLADANQNQVAQMQISVSDSTSTYVQGSTLKMKKQLEGTEQTITEGALDAELKIIIYLINADRYLVYLDNGIVEKAIGYLYVDPTDLSKTLIISQGLAGIDLNAANVSYSFNMTGGVLYLDYLDGASLTQNVSMWVWNTTDGTQLFYASSLNHSQVSFAYVTPDANATYKSRVLIHRTGYTLIDMVNLFTNAITAITDIAVPYLTIPFEYIEFAVLGVVMMIPMLFGGAFGAAAGIVMVLFAALLAYIGFFQVSILVLVLGGLIAVLNSLTKRRVEG